MNFTRREVLASAAAAGATFVFPIPRLFAEDGGDVAGQMMRKMETYLGEHQNADGSWGVPGKPGEIGITGLVLKGLNECPEKWVDAKPPFNIEKGVAWLLKQQQPDGSFTEERSGLTTYRTAITVLCLCSIDRAKYADPIAKARKWLEVAQFDEEEKVSKDSPHYGGWGYDHKGEKPDADLSNAQWAIMALKEAGVSKDDPVMKRAVEFVTRCQNNTETNKGAGEAKLKPSNDGGFYYGPSRATAKHTEKKNEDGTVTYESYASMTYAGLTSLIYAGMDPKDPRIQAALGWIKNHYTLEENTGLGVRAPDPKAAQMGLYYYYLTFARALSALETDEIETKDGKKRWAEDLVAALKARQKPDGSFVNEADRWMEGLPVLVTGYALNALNLAAKHLSKK